MIGDQLSSINQNQVTASVNSVVPQKITLDQIASTLLKENFILTALEFYTELSEVVEIISVQTQIPTRHHH
jgi:hypothetical protein